MKGGGFNAGFALLRLWMCCEVVLCHCWRRGGDGWGETFLYRMESAAVPVFMLMSFFLAAEKFAKNDAAWSRQRLGRVVVPYLVWSVIYFAVFFALSLVSSDPYFQVSPRDLGWQVLLGSSPKLNHQFWFQSVLVMLTVLTVATVRILRPRRIALVGAAFLFVSAVVQYSGLLGTAFDAFPYESKWTLGRIAPMLAYAGLGLMLGAGRAFIDRADGRLRLGVAFGALALFLVDYIHPLFALPPGGYGYDGFGLLFSATLLLAAFYYLPTERLPGRLVAGLKALSSYTMGVYCIHLLFARILVVFVFRPMGLGDKSVPCALTAGVLAWAACWLLARIPRVEGLVR